jgi:methylenetetrahydrofolate dehydrogenase (NADP+)/methenyltetrahydrofolate cyclohydrolase
VTGVAIDGTAFAEELRHDVTEKLGHLRLSGIKPGLGTVLLGDDPAAVTYERHVRRLAESMDFHYVTRRLGGDVEVADVLAVIGGLNADPRITGVILLHPLPPQIREADVYVAIDPLKDVEAVHPENSGLLAQGRPRFAPSTPASCFFMLDRYLRDSGRDPDTFYSGRTVALIGRSISVGKPGMWMALERDATVLAAHSHTAKAGRLGEVTLQADVLIVAAGVPGLVTGDMVREGVIAIDVGMNPVTGPDGKVRFVGDLDAPSVRAKAEAISPVPGGVGPITDVWLLKNAVAAAELVAFGRSHGTVR